MATGMHTEMMGIDLCITFQQGVISGRLGEKDFYCHCILSFELGIFLHLNDISCLLMCTITFSL